MKATINTKSLATALKALKPFAVKQRNPMLASVLIQAQADGRVTLNATNREDAMELRLQSTETAPGACVVLIKLLTDAVTAATGENVTLEARGNQVTVTSGGAVSAYPTAHAADFPIEVVGKALQPQDNPERERLQAKPFLAILDRVLPCASTDETRYNLNGVLLESVTEDEDHRGMHLVATDGHRLVRLSGALPATLLNTGSAIVSRRGLEIAQKAIKATKASEIEVRVSKTHMIIDTLTCTVAVSLVDGTFPDYRQVIPKTSERTVRGNRDALLAGLKPFAKVDGVKLTLSADGLNLEHKTADGAVERTVTATCDGELVIAFNPRYLTEALESITSDEVEIRLCDNLSPAVVAPQNDASQVCVVMPIRL